MKLLVECPLVPQDEMYLWRLKQAYFSDKADHRMKKFILEEVKQLRAKYCCDKKVDYEAIIEKECNTPVERPLYQNTKLDKLKVARFDKEADTTLDRVAKLIRAKSNGQD